MIRAAVLAIFLASAAVAQSADPADQLIEGYTACLAGAGDVAATDKAMTAFGWTRTDSDEEGLIYFSPASGEDSLVYTADDGSFCHVESLKFGSADASEALAAVLSSNGNTSVPSKDAMGCTRLDLDSGAQVTITSGGNDPVCASDTDSGVRFDFVAPSE